MEVGSGLGIGKTNHVGERGDVCLLKAAIVLQQLLGSSGGFTATPLLPAGRRLSALTPKLRF